MACTPEFCDPPAKDGWTVDLKISGGVDAAAGGSAAAGMGTGASGAGQGPGAGASNGGGLGPSFEDLDPFGDGPKLAIKAFFEPTTARAGEQVKLVVEVNLFGEAHLEVADVLTLFDHNGLPFKLGACGLHPVLHTLTEDGDGHCLGDDGHSRFTLGKTYILLA